LAEGWIEDRHRLKIRNKKYFMEGSDKYSMVNPYTNIYQSLNIEINELTTREESEEIVRHLGLLYNTMGLVMKDFVHILK
jgi:glycine cleavage system regulatory protein